MLGLPYGNLSARAEHSLAVAAGRRRGRGTTDCVFPAVLAPFCLQWQLLPENFAVFQHKMTARI
jgi:hypothetical protein